MSEAHELLVMVMADEGVSNYSEDETVPMDIDEYMDVDMWPELEAANISDDWSSASSESGILLIENPASLAYHDWSSGGNLLEDLSRPDWEGLSPTNHRTSESLSAKQRRRGLRSDTRRAETFMKLYDTIIRFLVVLSKQESSPLKTSQWPDNRNSTADIGIQGSQSTPNHLSASALQIVSYENGVPRDPIWEACKRRTRNILARLLQWKKEFRDGDLQAVLGGKSPMGSSGEHAVKGSLLTIGEKLSEMVAYQMIKVNGPLQYMAAKLDDSLRRGQEAEGWSPGDLWWSIFNDIMSICGVGAVDQQLDKLDSALDQLIRMGIPDVLKKTVTRRMSTPRKTRRERRRKTSRFGQSPDNAPPNQLDRQYSPSPTLDVHSEKVSTPASSFTFPPLTIRGSMA
ncbi:hypothetical protein O1611_g10416 [Lasiodiplodia mahajangana]|uniref:Uncharacterized protein n=1 Tax=Lasiodiplodia mahajangana TaxID=1108764 RepID=A0ACC2IYI0_9PEZI|nr:hypothetical protein O1611_g10416 [Lasiodiplodia mahajangana]